MPDLGCLAWVLWQLRFCGGDVNVRTKSVTSSRRSCRGRGIILLVCLVRKAPNFDLFCSHVMDHDIHGQFGHTQKLKSALPNVHPLTSILSFRRTSPLFPRSPCVCRFLCIWSFSRHWLTWNRGLKHALCLVGELLLAPHFHFSEIFAGAFVCRCGLVGVGSVAQSNNGNRMSRRGLNKEVTYSSSCPHPQFQSASLHRHLPPLSPLPFASALTPPKTNDTKKITQELRTHPTSSNTPIPDPSLLKRRPKQDIQSIGQRIHLFALPLLLALGSLAWRLVRRGAPLAAR